MKNNFRIFFQKGLQRSALKGNRELLRSAAVAFGVPEDEANSAVILTHPKGKPYFQQLDTHFSISHSEDIWLCLMGPSCCGVDVQYIKPCNYNSIAGRFFTQKEADYVAAHGLEGFYKNKTRLKD